MRNLLAAAALLAALISATAGHAQQPRCPSGGHWCGPGRGCCAPGETCAPKSGCLGGAERTGVPCGDDRCRTGFHCVMRKVDGRTLPRCVVDD